jgi:hypothetical protein
MRPIDKFILHVVHNWTNELNEAYSEGAVKKFVEKFREEADDLNITISDEQLKKYVERFDVLKNSPKIQEKDLNKYSLSKLIKLVTASVGAETEDEEEDRTPDVVYQDGGITIWNGSKEGNCINYGAGEKWCITRGSYGNYRYDSSKGYPTFYLAKNNNLPTSDKLSFVAIQIRDVNDENKRYVYTNRQNSPYESQPMSFSKLASEVPWLNDVPNIRNILRYIPLSSQERSSKVYSRSSVNIREWTKLPFNVKKQYLVARKGKKDLFDDISLEEFASKYLPQYPQIAEFVAVTPGIIDDILLLKNLEKYSNQDRKSITANLRTGIDIKYLSSEILPFDVKKLLTVLNKWRLSSEERIYVTKNGEAIVKLTFGDTVNVGVYTAEDDYPNIKLNQRTSKYLLDYPELDKIPFNIMINLASDGVLDKEILRKVIEKAKTEENSAIVVKEVDGKEIIVDSNSYASYKIEDGKITKIPFNDEDVQKVFAAEKENTAFQEGAVKAIETSYTDRINLPATLDKDAFLSVIKATPYDKRKISVEDEYIILTPDGESDRTIFLKSTNQYTNPFGTKYDFGNRGDDWRIGDYNNNMDEGAWRAYFAWMRNENKTYNSNDVIRMWRNSMSVQAKKDWFIALPPFDPTDSYAPVIAPNGMYCLVNKANPRESLRLADSGKLVKLAIPSTTARQLLGATPDQATPTAPAAQPAAGVPRRGRPAGGGQPQAAAPAAPDAGGDINVANVMEETGLEDAFLRLPRADFRRLNVATGVRVNPNGDRGAARRNNQLGNAGRVVRVIAVGDSKIYYIRLANQQIIASVNIQPGNRNYVLFGNEQGNVMIPMNSPSELMQVLQQRNLAEVRNYLIREYVANNPQHTNEVRKMIQKHIAETQNQ